LASQRPSSPVAIRPAVPLPVQAAASIPPRPHNPPQVPAVESAPKTPSPQAVAVDSRRGGAAFFKRTAPVPIDAEDSARLLQLEREARENELAKLRQARWVRDNEREQTRSAAARIEDPPLTQSSHPPTSRIVPSVIPLDPNPTVVAESSRRGHTDDVQPSTIPAAVIASPRKAVVRPDPEPLEKVDRPVPRRSTSRPVTPPPGPTSDDVSDVGSAASDVGRYLAQRKSSSSPNPAFLASRAAFAGKTLTTNGTRPMRNALPLAADNEASDGNESDDSEETTTEEESSSDEDPDVPEWSVRVCVVSAIDLPANVVPNLPFSPVFDIGLVRFPGPDVDSRIQLPGDDASRQNLSALLTKGGLHSVPRSRVQCTNLKTLSQRDNGSVEFHEELRWDRVKYPEELALAIQLSAKAVIAPANIKENPPMQKVQPLQFGNPSAQNGTGWNSAGKTSSGSSSEAGGSLFRRTQKGSAEMETANAAAAVAQLLVTGEKSKADDEGRLFDSKAANSKAVSGNRSELNVKLKHRKRRRKPKLTDDLRLGSQIVPLTALPLRKAYGQEHEARIEQWFELDGASDVIPTTPSPASSPARGNRRNPSILLEITFSAPEVLDDSEDELDDNINSPRTSLNASFSKRESIKIRNQLKQQVVVKAKEKVEEPVLEPGVVDFLCVVGARDIGDQRNDDGSSGWVNSTPECCVLEQFPPSDDFHVNNGRTATLPNKIEWFCFPDGCKLWRGSTPPNAYELNLRRFSASSPANISTSTASFDACLGCTTSFSWFVIASNSDEYGSDTAKTYGACIRFYVPAPTGIDPTQDDFAQMLMEGANFRPGISNEGKRLWVPVGICITSSLPIVGVMEAMLLRLCERLHSRGICSLVHTSAASVRDIYEDVASLIVNFQRPIPGVVNCSIPFLTGDRLHLAATSRSGLPSLPHGNAVTSVCRLLGADGLNFLIAAFLTECKILLHSDDVTNICLVAEVMTALMYPFTWTSPYVPVLPAEMMEFLEAPVSYLLGIPSCNVKLIDQRILEDIVVVDLDRDFCTSDEFFAEKRVSAPTFTPTPLPYIAAGNIAKAVNRLLQVEDAFAGSSLTNARSTPRLEPESSAEKDFRLAVSMEVCGLLRGFQDCLVYASSSQPVFNMEKFLKSAPALLEDPRELPQPASEKRGFGGAKIATRIEPSRSEQFLSCLVNCQHFHQLLELLDSEPLRFFHEIMEVINTNERGEIQNSIGLHHSDDNENSIQMLSSLLSKREDKVPTYRVKKAAVEINHSSVEDETTVAHISFSKFPTDLLQQIVITSEENQDSSDQAKGVKQLSLEYLVELEKNPWRYQKLFNFGDGGKAAESFVSIPDKVKLREAIGERRYNVWKLSLERDGDDNSTISEGGRTRTGSQSLNLGSLLNNGTDEMTSSFSASTSVTAPQDSSRDASLRKVSDAKHRDVVRRCLELANFATGKSAGKISEKELSVISEAEIALRSPSARQYLLTILGKRWQGDGTKNNNLKPNLRSSNTGERLDRHAFEVLVRIGCTMLDACLDFKEYESAYTLLKYTAGLYTSASTETAVATNYVTARLSLHPIYASLGVWEKVKRSHLQSRQGLRNSNDNGKQSDENEEEKDEYEASVTTLYEMLGYGIPAEELSRFASHVVQQKDWFGTDRGQSLLMLARRLCLRRDQGADSSIGEGKTDFQMMNTNGQRTQTDPQNSNRTASGELRFGYDGSLINETTWVEIGWCHPAAQSSKHHSTSDSSRRTGTQNILTMLDEQTPTVGGQNTNHMKRSAVTSMAYVGSSVVVSGGLDGGVFIARQVRKPLWGKSKGAQANVKGVHLDWGSSGSRYNVGSPSTSLDGEYGVGAVSCIASTRNTQHTQKSSKLDRTSPKDVVDLPSEEELLSSMDGCRIVAGTTCGHMRVWAVKDVLSAVFFAGSGEDRSDQTAEIRTVRRVGEGPSSSFVGSRGKGATDFSAGSSLTRLKFSLRGRALSGHRGGVSCIDVPSNIYRPDSIVSGGADGLIKLWNLRSPTASASKKSELEATTSRILKNKAGSSPSPTISPRTQANQSGDALSILSGHGGRVLCVKTAWHGDRLLSGGADRTVRIWDLAGSGGRCLNSLWGHFGWVTHVDYWGPNTIISASTDRSIALWDVRVRNSPLFTLRHHYAPISSLLVGSRTDPIMISAANDGTVAAWDFRQLSNADDSVPTPTPHGPSRANRCKIVRDPVATYFLNEYSSSIHVSGPVHIRRGRLPSTIQCLGSDAVVREWDIHSGDVIHEQNTGHCDSVSSFATLQGDQVADTKMDQVPQISGTISSSWDGTVRMRKLVKKRK
jgi:WD40 repeat protein